ncbi:hypothetical protein AI2834V1_2608 [Escherichia coli]|uniref:DUF551 domain-containing protein n=4 Tax=Escherichia coli TaxID=562 RepID=UPI001E00F75C|nr:hypothetical protein AI2834V1_2608 [Escherichia coli]CAH4927254.1 hypothetical protein AI2834V1_2608 [Escherichia coli]
MTTITKERAEIKSFITGFLSDPAHDNQSSDSLLANVFRIAQASLEAEPIAWRYRYVKKGVTDSQGEQWVGDWKYVPTKEDCNDRPSYEIQALFTASPVPVKSEGQGKADNQPASGNQAAESNRGNEWTGNPDIDNAIIMLDRIDTAESCDDDRIEAVKAVLRRLAGNYPVTPDGWISCSDRMPEETGDIIVVSDGIVMSGISYSRRDGFYITALEYDDDEPIGGVTHWMPLPEPPQEVK